MTRSRLAAAQGIATVVLLVLLFRGFDWMAFRALFAGLPLWFYAGSLLVVVAGLFLYAWRWRVLLVATGTPVSFRVVMQQYLTGIFLNNFLPSTLGGDAARVFYLGRVHGYRSVAVSVLLDRLLGFGLLSLLATVALWTTPIDHPRYVAARVALSGVTAVFVLVIGVAVTGTGGLPRRMERFGGRAVRMATRVQDFRIDLARAVQSPRIWVHSAATVAIYLALLTQVYQVFVSLQVDRRPGFVALLMAVASLSVLSTVPIAINAIGLREQLHVLLLEPLGVPKEVAVAISLLLFGHLVAASLVGGLLWWKASRVPDRVPDEAPPGESPDYASTSSYMIKSL